MGTNSKIEWTDHTFNPWMGCTKVSAGCKHCYAETLMDKRWGKVQWGPQGTRVRTSKEIWKKPLAWNKKNWRECLDCGYRCEEGPHVGPRDAKNYHICGHCFSSNMVPTRQRVFCASLADVFEDNPQVKDWRAELFALIDATPNLDWQILTKRPEKIFDLGTDAVGEIFDNWLARHPNVWMGTSVEDQATANERIPYLLTCMAAVRFLSIEPLLWPVKIFPLQGFIEWVIVGGESGPDARPMHPDWVRSIRDQCLAGGVPFFFKQNGEWLHVSQLKDDIFGRKYHSWSDGSGSLWLGKEKAGRMLDGSTWSQFPTGQAV